MGSFSLIHWIVVLLVILIFFGRGKISETMGDFGKGIRSFKKGMAEAENDVSTPPPAPPAQLPPAQAPAQAEAAKPADPSKTDAS